MCQDRSGWPFFFMTECKSTHYHLNQKSSGAWGAGAAQLIFHILSLGCSSSAPLPYAAVLLLVG